MGTMAFSCPLNSSKKHITYFILTAEEVRNYTTEANIIVCYESTWWQLGKKLTSVRKA